MIIGENWKGEKELSGNIRYGKLLQLMEEKGITSYKIRKQKIISESALQNIRNNGCITTDTIAKLCYVLDCQPGDILEYVPDQSEQDISKIPENNVK